MDVVSESMQLGVAGRLTGDGQLEPFGFYEATKRTVVRVAGIYEGCGGSG